MLFQREIHADYGLRCVESTIRFSGVADIGRLSVMTCCTRHYIRIG